MHNKHIYAYQKYIHGHALKYMYANAEFTHARYCRSIKLSANVFIHASEYSWPLCSIMLFLEIACRIDTAAACPVQLSKTVQQHIPTHNVPREVRFANTSAGSVEIWL